MPAETFIYLVTRGRNSGLPRRREVWFVEVAGMLYLLTETQERVEWVKNIEASPEVTFSIGTRRNESSQLPLTQGLGRIVDERNELELCAHVRNAMRAKYRWSEGLIIEVSQRTPQ
jgi:hypothetical protein